MKPHNEVMTWLRSLPPETQREVVGAAHEALLAAKKRAKKKATNATGGSEADSRITERKTEHFDE